MEISASGHVLPRAPPWLGAGSTIELLARPGPGANASSAIGHSILMSPHEREAVGRSGGRAVLLLVVLRAPRRFWPLSLQRSDRRRHRLCKREQNPTRSLGHWTNRCQWAISCALTYWVIGIYLNPLPALSAFSRSQVSNLSTPIAKHDRSRQRAGQSRSAFTTIWRSTQGPRKEQTLSQYQYLFLDPWTVSPGYHHGAQRHPI